MPAVPWTSRDVWLGVAMLVLWFGVVFAIQLISLKLKVDAGVFISFAEALLLIPVAILGLRKYRSGWAALGLRRFKGQTIAIGCGLMTLFFSFNFIYSTILALFHVREQVDLTPIIGKLSSPVWFWIGGALVAPVVEEIFFRGFLFGGLRQAYGFQKAAIVSAVLFGAVHLQLTTLIPIAILGYLFAFLYELSGSIWPGILMHFVTNACALSAAFYLANR
jgi:CAAX protease family protein